MLLTRAPLYSVRRPFALDLHVLGAPPTFVLSQDQTLQFNLESKSDYLVRLTTPDVTLKVYRLENPTNLPFALLFSCQRPKPEEPSALPQRGGECAASVSRRQGLCITFSTAFSRAALAWCVEPCAAKRERRYRGAQRDRQRKKFEGCLFAVRAECERIHDCVRRKLKGRFEGRLRGLRGDFGECDTPE